MSAAILHVKNLVKRVLSSMSVLVAERVQDWGRVERQREGEGELDIWGIPLWFWWGLAVGDQLYSFLKLLQQGKGISTGRN